MPREPSRPHVLKLTDEERDMIREAMRMSAADWAYEKDVLARTDRERLKALRRWQAVRALLKRMG